MTGSGRFQSSTRNNPGNSCVVFLTMINHPSLQIGYKKSPVLLPAKAGTIRRDEGGCNLSKRLTEIVIKLFCLVAILAFNGSVSADAELYTSPIANPPNGGLDASCSIVNVSDKTRTVTIEVREGAAIGGTTTAELPSGAGMFLDFPLSCTDGCNIYCKFSVQGNKHEYRASICDDNVGCLAAE